MDDIERFEIVAEAASLVARANPNTPDDLIGRAVATVVSKAIIAGMPDDEFTADLLSTGADYVIMVFNVGERTLDMLSVQVDEGEPPRQIDMDTELSALKLSADDLTVLKSGFSQIFGVDGMALDMSGERKISDLVQDIVEAMSEDEHDHDHEHESHACSHGVEGCCGGNPSAYRQNQDADIARLGVTLAPVLPSDEGPGFVYSIGMSEQGKTDVIFIGDYTPPTYGYLTMFLRMQMEGTDLPIGLFPPDHEHNTFGVPVWVLGADEKIVTHACGAATRLERIGSDRPARLAQVIMPDKSNRFPWDVGYDWINQQTGKSATTA